MNDGDSREAPCPDCGHAATFTYSRYLGREYHWCDPCIEKADRERKARKATIRQLFPALSERIVTCLDRYGLDGGVPAILAAEDDDLLEIRNFGPKMLAEFRAVWPTPVPTAAMSKPAVSAHFWEQRHDVLSLIGG